MLEWGNRQLVLYPGGSEEECYLESEEGSSSKLHDWMGKLNINVDDFGKKRQTEPFVFMGGMNVLFLWEA